MASVPEEIIIKELTFGEETQEEEGAENDQMVYHLPSRYPSNMNKCKIIRDGVGFYRGDGLGDGKIIDRFTLINVNNVAVQIMTYGGTISSIKVPDNNGNFDDVVLGFDNFEGYRSSKNPYFGATIGRITGVIPQYVFSVDNEKYYVSKNFLSDHHANGGFVGFDKVIWNNFVAFDKLYLSYMSKDTEEGFPGDVLVNRSYELTEKDELIIETTATCTRPTPVDITTHVDWNLASHAGGPHELYKHYLMLNADKYAQVDSERFLTGKLKRVSGTVLDLRIPRPLGKLIHKIPGGGYDHYFGLTRGNCKKGIIFAAKLVHPGTGRIVEVLTDQPGLQVYTQNNLYASKNIVEGHPISCWCHDPIQILRQQQLMPVPMPEPQDPEEQGEEDEQEEEKAEEPPGDGYVFKPLAGKLGFEYVRHGGIRLVPVNYPEPLARNRERIPYLLHPGENYTNTTIFKFGTLKGKPKNLAHVEEGPPINS